MAALPGVWGGFILNLSKDCRPIPIRALGANGVPPLKGDKRGEKISSQSSRAGSS